MSVTISSTDTRVVQAIRPKARKPEVRITESRLGRWTDHGWTRSSTAEWRERSVTLTILELEAILKAAKKQRPMTVQLTEGPKETQCR